jgi:hypothetical protein
MPKKPSPPRPVPPRPPRNEFGDPPDTLYAGGTPRFDERTGRSVPPRPPRKRPPKR